MSPDHDDAFDPTHLLDGWKAASTPSSSAPPPELDLSALHGTAAPPPAAASNKLDAERIARLKKRGFEMDDIEDVELPEIRMPLVEEPPAFDLADLADVGVAANAVARFAQERPRNPRLLDRWQAGAWVGVCRRALGASTEFIHTPQGPLVENRPPQWLLALWPPQRLDEPLLGRWPEIALLGAAEDAQAAAEALLLPVLPGAASVLWLSELEADWALLAELVLHQDPALQPFQLKALRELAEQERLASFALLNSAYEAASGGRPLRRKPVGATAAKK